MQKDACYNRQRIINLKCKKKKTLKDAKKIYKRMTGNSKRQEHESKIKTSILYEKMSMKREKYWRNDKECTPTPPSPLFVVFPLNLIAIKIVV